MNQMAEMKDKSKSNITDIIVPLLIVSLLLFYLFIAVGCDNYNDDEFTLSTFLTETEAEATVGEKGNNMIYIWTDEDTGVQYVVYREESCYAGFGGITPRLNSDGSLYISSITADPEADRVGG